MNWSLSDFDSLGDLEEINKWIIEINKVAKEEEKEYNKSKK